MGSRLWDTDPWEEDCVAAVVERQLHRFLSRACAFAIVCFTDPERGSVIRFTGDVRCLRGGLRCENPPAVTIVVSDYGQKYNKANLHNLFV